LDEEWVNRFSWRKPRNGGSAIRAHPSWRARGDLSLWGSTLATRCVVMCYLLRRAGMFLTRFFSMSTLFSKVGSDLRNHLYHGVPLTGRHCALPRLYTYRKALRPSVYGFLLASLSYLSWDRSRIRVTYSRCLGVGISLPNLGSEYKNLDPRPCLTRSTHVMGCAICIHLGKFFLAAAQIQEGRTDKRWRP